MDMIQVKTEAQLRQVEQLAREVWTEHYIPIIGEEQVEYMLGRFQTVKAMQAQLEDGYDYYIITDEGSRVGYLAVKQEGTDSLFLSKVYVLKSYRGKGLGRKAMDFVRQYAESKELKKVKLTVNKNNKGSIRAYEKVGFVNCGSVVMDIGGGYVMDDYLMEKRVR